MKAADLKKPVIKPVFCAVLRYQAHALNQQGSILAESMRSSQLIRKVNPSRPTPKPGRVGSAFLPTDFAKWWANDKAVCPPYRTEHNVSVGRHIPPRSVRVDELMRCFE
jgi:hypothetical protein